MVIILLSLDAHDVVEGVVGETAKLRCKATKSSEGDRPVLVLWYKVIREQIFRMR